MPKAGLLIDFLKSPSSCLFSTPDFVAPSAASRHNILYRSTCGKSSLLTEKVRKDLILLRPQNTSKTKVSDDISNICLALARNASFN